jgi:hypothetical protein
LATGAVTNALLATTAARCQVFLDEHFRRMEDNWNPEHARRPTARNQLIDLLLQLKGK